MGALAMRLQEQVDEQALDRGRIVADLVVAGRDLARQFQPVQRRLAGHRRAVRAPRRQLARQHRHQRIVAQLVVIVEVLVAQRDAEHPLADQRAPRCARSTRAAVRPRKHAANRSTRPIARSVAPSSSPPASDVIAPPSKSATTRRPSTGANLINSASTLCRHRGTSPFSTKSFSCEFRFNPAGYSDFIPATIPI